MLKILDKTIVVDCAKTLNFPGSELKFATPQSGITPTSSHQIILMHKDPSRNQLLLQGILTRIRSTQYSLSKVHLQLKIKCTSFLYSFQSAQKWVLYVIFIAHALSLAQMDDFTHLQLSVLSFLTDHRRALS